MNKYYKVSENSETGKKFAEIEKEGIECQHKAVEFVKKYGFNKYKPSRISYMGGVSCCAEPVNNIIPPFWKNNDGDFTPKRNTKEGKKIGEEMESLPYVDIDELNNIINYDGNVFKSSHIGFSGLKNGYYGAIIPISFNVIPPKDCEEITLSEYQKLFNYKN